MIIYKRKRKKLVIPVGLGPNVSEITGYELQNKTVDSSTVEQTVYSDVDYYGLYSVKVRPYILDAKTIDSSTVQQVVTSDASALYQVIVNPYTLENRTQTITQNGEYSFTPEDADGLARVDISVNVADIPAVVQTKSVVYTENGEYSVEPDEGYDGLSHVTIDVSVEGQIINNQSKTVDSSTTIQYVQPDQGYTGLDYVAVNPYTVKSDSSTLTQNGTYVFTSDNTDALSQVTVDVSVASSVPELQNKTVDSSTTQQTVQADSSYDGLSQVTVNPYILDSKTVDASINSVTVNSSEDGLSSVTVNAVTAEIDPNIQDYNIVEGVTILGVTGSRHIANLQLVKYADSSTTVVDVYPDQGYDGMRAVYVRPYHLSTDSSVLTQNGQYVFEPSAGYNGLSQVTVDVSVHASVNLQSKIANPSTTLQYITPDQGYDGLSEVAVNPYQLQYKTLNRYSYSSSSNTVTPEEGYNGLSYVTVYWPGLMDITLDASTVAQVITPASRSTDYFNNITVNPYTTEADSSVLTQNGTYTFTPQNADALSQVTVDVSVSGGGSINNQNKTVDSSTVSQSITADQGYTGLGTVTVNPYSVQRVYQGISRNGTYTFTPANADAISNVTVDIRVDSGTVDRETVVYVNNVSVGPAPDYTQTLQRTNVMVRGANETLKVIPVNGGAEGIDSSLFVVYGAIDGFVGLEVPWNGYPTYVNTIEYQVYTLSFASGTPSQRHPIADQLTASGLEKIKFPILTRVDYDMSGWIVPWNDIDLEINWHALTYDSSVFNLTHDLGSYLKNLDITMSSGVHTDSYITDSIYLDWSSSLTADSVLGILQKLDPSTSGESVTFYTNGLTIDDYPDGRIRNAYNAAVAAGWTINNLTINSMVITLLEYITSGDSHTENNQIQLPCNVTNDTVIQFTVNWRDDQGGAFIATAARDFNQNEWRTFGYNNCLYSDLGGGNGGNRFYVYDTWSAVYHQYGTIEIGVDSSYHIYQKDVSTGTTYTSTSTTQFRSIGTDHISYIGSDYTWLREIKVYENGINNGLTYDFVAAKDQYDVPGLYDTVGGVMYYATSGSMIAGPVLS